MVWGLSWSGESMSVLPRPSGVPEWANKRCTPAKIKLALMLLPGLRLTCLGVL